MVLGKLPGTAISTAHNRGTISRPMLRAEAAGKSEIKSGVQVKRTEIKSAGLSWFDSKIFERSSTTPAFINAGSSASI
jgi:hypothetical protein